MDGGQIDAQESTATAVLVPRPWPAPPAVPVSRLRRMRLPPPTWHRSLPWIRRGSLSPWHRASLQRWACSPCGPPKEPLQLRLFPESRATEVLPLWLASHPTHSCHFSSRRSIAGKEIPHLGGQASKVKQPTEIFPLLAWFGLLASCWFGVVLIRMTSSFLASKTTHF